MRSLGTATLLIALTAPLGLAGCGSEGGDADDVPTITTRPSATTSSPATPGSTAPSTGTSAPSEPPTTQTSDPAPTETGSGPSPEPPTDEPVGPTTYAEARARIAEVGDVAPAPVTASRFSTAGDVVYCLLDDPVIGPACELRTGFVKDEEVCGSGAADGVGRVETFEGKAVAVCNTDTIREPGSDELGAPAVVTVTGGGIDCAVERAGVTCVETRARTGFYLGPGEYHVF